jgi:hypothetical protein
MRAQVEERLSFFDSGVIPRKNIDVMHSAAQLAAAEGLSSSLFCRLLLFGAKFSLCVNILSFAF